MTNIPYSLKEKLFETIVGKFELHEFEQWLYEQTELTNRLKEAFYFELFDFSYKQKDAKAHFKNLVEKNMEKEEFRLFLIKAMLKKISRSKQLEEGLLYELYQLWYYEDVEFIAKLASFHLEIDEIWCRPNKVMLAEESSIIAADMLKQLEKAERKAGFELAHFKYNPKLDDKPVPDAAFHVEKLYMPVRRKKKWWIF